MDMPARTLAERIPNVFLKALKGLPFVRKVSFAPAANDSRVDGVLMMRAGKEQFTIHVVQERSYLDRASLHALITLAAVSHRPLMLFARYIPRPSGDQLIKAGVNFVDEAGNLHVLLGKQYAQTILGRPQAQKPTRERHATPAQVQLLFAYAAEPAILTRPVREIARQAGISKSKAAQIRQQLIGQSQRETPGPPSGALARALQQRLLAGYSDVLRPKLLLGRFRAPEPTAHEFLGRLRQTAEPAGLRVALTGGPAAEQLQHFYQGPDVPLFIDPWNSDVRQRLRLQPDRECRRP